AGNAENKNADAVKVEVEQVKAVNASQTFAYSGTIEESEMIPLSFSSLGTVSQVFISEGSIVKKGQLLATLDNTTYRNAYAMAHATEQQAVDAYDRLTPMHKNGNLSEVKYVEVETGLHQAKAAAAIAKKSLDDCNLYATTDGVVGKRAIDVGMVAMPNLTSITIVKIAKVFARVSVSENEIASIKKGQIATIKVGALEDTEYKGKVEEIGVMADPIAHTYKIKIGIVNTNHEIKPGMICTVQINTAVGKRGVVVPSQSVMVDETGKTFVFMLDASGKQAFRKYIKTGKLLNNGVEVTEGIEYGATVVTAGQHKLADHSFVSIIGR
ncbi:MAG TPA: efflux RND transporter periplasmic adaptor subunit, partial [Bacteroidota bacterium]|nr:efflux RND transporter periplasmic adaptor subunit [Bacteroidota bacterium]